MLTFRWTSAHCLRDGAGDTRTGRELRMLSQGRMTILAAMTGRMTHILKKHLTRAESPKTIIAGSPDRRIAGSPDRRIAGSPDRRIAGSPDRRIAGSPDRRIAGSPDRRIAGSPDRRIAGSPDRRIAGSPDRRIAQPAYASRDRSRPLASRPEPSATTTRHLRRCLTAALLALPLLVTGAQAQTGPVTADLSFDGASPLPEGAGGVFTVGLSRALGRTETVKLPLTIGGTATLGTDYQIVCIDASPAGSATCNDIKGDSSSITFHGAHMTGTRKRTTGPLRLQTIEDGTFDPGETVTLQLGGRGATTIKIVEAPASVKVAFTKATFKVAEGGGLFQPVFGLDNAPGRDLVIPLIFTDMTSTSGTDYTPIAGATIPANGKNTSTFDIPIIDDDDHEGDETFTVTIDRARLPAGVTVGSQSQATFTITDDDSLPPMPQILLSNDNMRVKEPAHASCEDSHVGTEKTFHYNQNTGKLERVERHYGNVLTSVNYKVKLANSPGGQICQRGDLGPDRSGPARHNGNKGASRRTRRSTASAGLRSARGESPSPIPIP